MDFEEKRPLVKKIDQSLLKHAAELGAKEGGPELTDVYRLQGLAETHRYLRWQHEFQPGEVEALLRFEDPLAVVRRCWEERDPEKGFPICDLLQKVEAEKLFPLLSPQAREEEALLQALNDLLDKNMSDFDAALPDMTAEEIAGDEEITSTRETYMFIRYNQEFDRDEAELLLRMENPLKFIVDNWPCYDLAELARSALENKAMEDAGKDAADQQKSEPSQPGTGQHKQEKEVVPRKPSVRRQLREAMQETGRQPLQQDRAKGGEAR